MISTETGILVMLTILTASMIVVRFKARLDTNWLPLYWCLMVVASMKIEGSWNQRAILGGLGAALILRFEFLATALESMFRLAEMGVFGYVLYRACVLLAPR